MLGEQGGGAGAITPSPLAAPPAVLGGQVPGASHPLWCLWRAWMSFGDDPATLFLMSSPSSCW